MDQNTKDKLAREEQHLRTAPARIEIIKGFLAGKPIQTYSYNSSPNGESEWVDCHHPIWNWDTDKYRLKPEEAYAPFTMETFPLGVVWIKSNTDRIPSNRMAMVIAVTSDNVIVSSNSYTYYILCRDFLISTNNGKSWQKAGIKL